MSVKRTAVVQFSVWLLVTGSAVTFTVWRYHYGKRVETAVVLQKQIKNVERVWFAENGTLYAADRLGPGMEIREIPAGGPAAGSQQNGRVISTISGDGPYGIAPDGEAVVAAKGTSLSVTSLHGDPAIRHNSSRRSDIVHLAWIDGSVILALHGDGDLEALDASTLVPRADFDTGFKVANAMFASGTFVAVASSDRKQIRVLDMRMLPQISVSDRQELPNPFTCLAMSASARVALCTQAAPTLAGAPIPGVAKANRIEFYDDEHLLITSDTGTILFGDPDGPMPVADVPASVQSLAVADGKLAFASPVTVTLLTTRITPPISDAGWLIIWRWLGATAIIAMFFFVRAMFLRADRAHDYERDEQLAETTGPR